MGGDACICMAETSQHCKAIILQLKKKKRNHNKLGNQTELPARRFEPMEGLSCFSASLACFASGVTFLAMM